MSFKDRTFHKIWNKVENNQPLTKGEELFGEKYFGISKSKDGPKSAEERLKVRKLAKDMATRDFIQEAGPDAAQGYEPSEEQVQDYMLESANFLYPNASIEDAASLVEGGRIASVDEMGMLGEEQKAGIDKFVNEKGKKVTLDIELPNTIKTTGQALKYLTKQGMNESEAKEWLRARLQ